MTGPSKPSSPIDAVGTAWIGTGSPGLPEPELVLQRLDVARASRRYLYQGSGRELAEADELDKRLRDLASTILSGSAGGELWEEVSRGLEAPDGMLLTTVRRVVDARRNTLMVVSLGSFILLSALLAVSRTVDSSDAPIGLFLAAMGVAAVVASSVSGLFAVRLLEKGVSGRSYWTWMVPPAALLFASVLGLLLSDEDTYFAGAAAVAIVGALITTIIVARHAGHLPLFSSRPRDLPSQLISSNLPSPEAALVALLYNFILSRSARERLASRAWLSLYILVAFIGAVGAAVAGSTLVSDTNVDPLIGYVALAGAGATALAAGLNPGHEWKQSGERSRMCDALARQVLAMYRLDMDEYEREPPRAREAVQHVLDRLDTILLVPETATFWSLTSASSNIEPMEARIARPDVVS